MPGHLARECPYAKQQSKGDREARGRKEHSVAHVMPAEEGSLKKIEELRHELHEAELAAGLESRAGVIKNVTWSDGGECILGPTFTTRMEVNGVPTEALIDTGSPVTIISLDLAMDVVAKEKPHFSSAEEWKAEMKKRFVPPTISLKSYGGGRLDMMAQLPVQLTQGEYKVDAQVLVQKDAPNSLLLGTDVQQPLGFSLLRKEGCGVDLITGRRVGLSARGSEEQQALPSTVDAKGAREEKPASTTMVEPDQVQAVIEPDQQLIGENSVPVHTGVVRLLTATRIPPRYKKMVRAKVEGEVSKELSLFTPCSVFVPCSRKKGLDSALEAEEGRCAVLVMGICRCKGGSWGKWSLLWKSPRKTCVTMLSVTSYLKRIEERNCWHLTADQQRKLKDVILSYADVFALD